MNGNSSRLVGDKFYPFANHLHPNVLELRGFPPLRVEAMVMRHVNYRKGSDGIKRGMQRLHSSILWKGTLNHVKHLGPERLIDT